MGQLLGGFNSYGETWPEKFAFTGEALMMTVAFISVAAKPQHCRNPEFAAAVFSRSLNPFHTMSRGTGPAECRQVLFCALVLVSYSLAPKARYLGEYRQGDFFR